MQRPADSLAVSECSTVACCSCTFHNTHTAGRPETLSPTRGERLAQLKRRQNEKRGSSAAGGPRPDLRDYSPSPDCSPSYASGQAIAAAFANSSMPATAGAYADGCNGSDWASSYGSATSPRSRLGAGADGNASSLSSGRGSPNVAGAAAAPAPAPSPLLKWNLQTTPDNRPNAQQQAQHQQQVSGSSLMHLHSFPAGYSPEPGGSGTRSRPPAASSMFGASPAAGPAARRGSSDLAAMGRPGMAPLSAAAAEAPTYSPSSGRPTVSAAAVLTGTGARGFSNSSDDGNSSNGSPTIRQRRLGAGGSLGLQQPVSASPEYPGASKSSIASRRAAGSPAFGAAAGSPAQLRAQTAAAAVGLNADWAAAGFGSGSGSPSAGVGSPNSRRGGVFDRPQSVGPEGVDVGADLAPLQDPEASLR